MSIPLVTACDLATWSEVASGAAWAIIQFCSIIAFGLLAIRIVVSIIRGLIE